MERYEKDRSRSRLRSRDRRNRDSERGDSRKEVAGLRKPRRDLTKLERFKKDFYASHPDVEDRFNESHTSKSEEREISKQSKPPKRNKKKEEKRPRKKLEDMENKIKRMKNEIRKLDHQLRNISRKQKKLKVKQEDLEHRFRSLKKDIDLLQLNAIADQIELYCRKYENKQSREYLIFKSLRQKLKMRLLFLDPILGF